MAEKNLLNVGRKIFSLIGSIQFEKNPSARLEVTLEIRDKEIPFSGTPSPGIFPAPVERSGKGGDQIKFPAEFRQWFKCGDSVISAVDSEKIDQAVEDRDASDVESDAMMPERLGDEEKKTAPATDVQNFLRRKPLQIQILSAPDINRKAALQVQILRIMPPKGRRSRRKGTAFRAQGSEPPLIDLREKRRHRDGMKNSANAAPGPPIRQRLTQFGD